MGPNWLFWLGLIDSEEDEEEKLRREGDEPAQDFDSWDWEDREDDTQEDPNQDFR
jgi:hypothetical protein